MKRLMISALAMMVMITVVAEETVIEQLAPDIVRVRMTRNGKLTESLMNRYGTVEKLNPVKVAALPEGFTMPKIEQTETGFKLDFPLTEKERVYGLGDASRENVNRRGGKYEIWVANMTCYIPIPMAISSEGRGLFVNCAARNLWDVGATKADTMTVSSDLGEVDFYLFKGKDYKALLDAYTRLTGRPALLPAFAYGFTYVANQWIDQYQVAAEAYEFRRHGIPCDAFGLEPGWMEYFYDSTTKKELNRRFKLPYWVKPSSNHLTWIGALNRMGFKLSLWMCMNYDLFVFEEGLADGTMKKTPGKKLAKGDPKDEGFEDERIATGRLTRADGNPKDAMRLLNADIQNARREMIKRPDGLTGEKQDGKEPWFDHLRKFVDRDARCFKLDGAWQVTPFPDRKWAGKYTDEQVHNIYSLVYGKQMSEGYEDYTGDRAMVYTAGGYAGLQRYVATWAGDTGGGVKPMRSELNLGASGHPNQSMDVTIDDLTSLHAGVFSPWLQQNNWDYFDQPWYRDADKLAAIKDYVILRYRLFPYIYSMAAYAAKTGWPMVRPLAFVYPEVEEYANVGETYLFGDSMLVSAFTDEIVIPAGDWYEWRTGEKVTGPCKRKVVTDSAWGGALYVKAGAIIPMWPVKQHLEQGWNDVVELHVWPGADNTFSLYEDDGNTIEYRKGAGATTEITLKDGKVTIGEVKGSFKGMPAEKREFRVIQH